MQINHCKVKKRKKAANTKKSCNKNATLLETSCQVEETSHPYYSKSFQNRLSILLLMYLTLEYIVC